MLFSSVTFLYWFLPIIVLLYYIIPMRNGSPRLRNTLLLLASLVFYGWGEPIYMFLMILEITVIWSLGLLIDKYRGKGLSKVYLVLSLIAGLGTLAFFKYADFFLRNINGLMHTDIPLLRFALPIGISFYTFQILSYSIDLYRGNTDVQKNIVDFAAYAVLFPQLIAGPIVRYADVALELGNREHSLARFSFGVRRFIFGLAKKVLLSNLLGELSEIMKISGDNSVLSSWLYIVSFTMHIYFDFSGYSDMAIGLGHIFGFKFLENFNYPYISESISEFWRRWHISLSSWFRDYVYIPLGGNRVRKRRFVFNVLLVWVLTGFWHGAEWTFMMWGIYFGVILLFEKFFAGKYIEKLPKILRHAYVILIVMISWVFFDAPNFTQALSVLSKILGVGADSFVSPDSLYYLRSYLILLIISILGVTPIPKIAAGKISERALTVFEPLTIAILLFMITAFLVDGSFNPFIYFRF